MFTVDLPSMITPPQSPTALDPASLLDVNTIGFEEVPTALIFEPLVITKEELAKYRRQRQMCIRDRVSVAPFFT